MSFPTSMANITNLSRNFLLSYLASLGQYEHVGFEKYLLSFLSFSWNTVKAYTDGLKRAEACLQIQLHRKQVHGYQRIRAFSSRTRGVSLMSWINSNLGNYILLTSPPQQFFQVNPVLFFTPYPNLLCSVAMSC